MFLREKNIEGWVEYYKIRAREPIWYLLKKTNSKLKSSCDLQFWDMFPLHLWLALVVKYSTQVGVRGGISQIYLLWFIVGDCERPFRSLPFDSLLVIQRDLSYFTMDIDWCKVCGDFHCRYEDSTLFLVIVF